MRHMRIFRPAAVAAAFGLAVLGGTGWASLAAPAAQAGTAPCMVTDQETHASYTSLQAAQNAASPGDTLSATGTCTGTTEITKNLTITGGATLDGDQAGSVLTIEGVTVTITGGITITGGNASFGGGIYNDGGSVTLTGGSTINGNTASESGGGIFNTGSVTLNDGSHISGNTAADGGGIYNDFGTVTLNGGSTINGNTASEDGGGIFNNFGTVTLTGGSHITGNTASLNTAVLGPDGGGIFNFLGTVTLTGGSHITGNKPDNCAPPGSVPGCSG